MAKQHVAQVPWRSRPYSADVPDDGDNTPVEILSVTYRCANGHERVVPLASTVEFVPPTWDCNRCSLTAEVVDAGGKQVGVEAEDSGRDYHPRSHYQEVLTRRTEAELQVLLDERLAFYRNYRHGEVGMHLKEGEQVLTRAGNLTTPFPRIDTSTGRKASATLKRTTVWLVENARLEAGRRGDRHGALLMGAIDLSNVSLADTDGAEAYLFG